jgi:hypothetical protein
LVICGEYSFLDPIKSAAFFLGSFLFEHPYFDHNGFLIPFLLALLLVLTVLNEKPKNDFGSEREVKIKKGRESM